MSERQAKKMRKDQPAKALAGKKKPEAMNEWYDEYHGSIMQKSNRRKTCFTWLAGQRPTAMCIPAEESTLAEWQQNMTGKVVTKVNVSIADLEVGVEKEEK